MNRRDFTKFLGLLSIAPSALLSGTDTGKVIEYVFEGFPDNFNGIKSKTLFHPIYSFKKKEWTNLTDAEIRPLAKELGFTTFNNKILDCPFFCSPKLQITITNGTVIKSDDPRIAIVLSSMENAGILAKT